MAVLYLSACVGLIFIIETMGEPCGNVTGSFYKALLEGHEKYLRPMTNQSNTTTVEMLLYLMGIKDVDLKDQTVTANILLEVRWKDERLNLNNGPHRNIPFLTFDSEKVWKPDLIISSFDYSLVAVNYKDVLLRVFNDGSVITYPYAQVTLGFDVDVTYYPFDTQTISFLVEPWSYPVKDLEMKIDEKFNPKDFLSPNGEWEVERYHIVHLEYMWSEEVFKKTGYSFNIRRKSLYYSLNILAPVVILSLLNTLSFVLPVSSGDRVTLCISIFLTLTVFLTFVNDALPRTSQGVSICALYIGLQMFGSAFTVFMIVVIICIDNKNSAQEKLYPEFKGKEYLKLTCCETKNNPHEHTESKSIQHTTQAEDTEPTCQRNTELQWKSLSRRLNNICLWLSIMWNLVLFVLLVSLRPSPYKEVINSIGN